MKFIFHKPKDYLFLDYLVNPLPALAIIGMGINDHFLKYAYPSWFTGKVSDFLGLFYFPLFLCGIYCFYKNFILNKRKTEIFYINKKQMLFAITISGLLMTSININEQFTNLVEIYFAKYFFKISLTTDITDLWSLLSLPLSYWYATLFFPYNEALLQKN